MHEAIYGYMRLIGDEPSGEETQRVTQQLSEYAAREGFSLDRIFTETGTTSESTFAGLLQALQGSAVSNVIVPSLWHFASLPGLQEAMRLHIEQTTGARLWVVQRWHP